MSYFRSRATSFLLALTFIPLQIPAEMPDRFLRDARPSDIATEMTARGLAASGEVLVQYAGEPSFRVERLPKGSTVESGVRTFASRRDVVYAEPNYVTELYAVPNDQFYSYQWNLSKLNMPTAWDASTGSGVTVAILDTGVAYENYSSAGRQFLIAPDLASTQFAPGYDFVNNDAHPNDDHGHGTHVAGTVAQSTGNSVGVAGVAYNARIMPIKVLSATGAGTSAALANGIRFAADNGAQVINISLGSTASSATVESAIQYAYEKGVTIIAASGNSSATSVAYPAAHNAQVIAVGATRFDNTRASYSNSGSALDIMAPGGDSAVDQNGDGYGDGILQQTFTTGNPSAFGYFFNQGTSMASPHVAGIAALLISKGNATTPTDVRTAIESTAIDLGTPGRDNLYGHGLINPVGALSWVKNAPPPPPPPEEEPEDPTPEPPAPPTEIEVFADGFEVSEWNGKWTEDTQNDWFRSTQRTTEGRRSAEVDGSAGNASLTSSAFSMLGKTSARITFSWFIETSLDTGEYVAFDTYANGVWTERARLSGNVTQENVWHAANVAVTNAPDLKIRFRGSMSGSDEDANVDNVRVVAF